MNGYYRNYDPNVDLSYTNDIYYGDGRYSRSKHNQYKRARSSQRNRSDIKRHKSSKMSIIKKKRMIRYVLMVILAIIIGILVTRFVLMSAKPDYPPIDLMNPDFLAENC